MRHALRMETRIGDLVAAAFDEAARYTTDERARTRLAHDTVKEALRGRTRRLRALVVS